MHLKTAANSVETKQLARESDKEEACACLLQCNHKPKRPYQGEQNQKKVFQLLPEAFY